MNACAVLAREVAQAVVREDCDGVVATGGETAKALALALAARHLQRLREVEPGIPPGLLHIEVDGCPHGLPLATKAGGFGDTNTLITCVQALQGVSQ